MSFFQKMGNRFSRFMYGRNGGDQLGFTMMVVGLAMDAASMFTKNEMADALLTLGSSVIMVLCLVRMFSRNLQKRRAENAKFLEKVWWPLKRKFGKAKQQAQDKEHKYFTCPNCSAVCRVPRGKGKVVITCPRCRTQIHGKT